MEEVGRQVLTNAQAAMQPGLWGGTEVRKALSKRDGEAAEEGTAGGWGPISCTAEGVSMDTSLLGWHRVSAVCRGRGVTPNQPGVWLLVPISPRCSGRGQATAWGTNGTRAAGQHPRMPETAPSHRGVGTPAQVPASLEGAREHTACVQARQKMFA